MNRATMNRSAMNRSAMNRLAALALLCTACASAAPRSSPGPAAPGESSELQPPRPIPALDHGGSREPAPAAPVATLAGETEPASGDAAQSAEGTPPAGARARSDEGVLGWVAGAPIPWEELVLEWRDVSERELWLVIDKLVAAHLATAESQRLGLALDPAALDQGVAAARTSLEERLAREGPERTLREYVEGDLGRSWPLYLDRLRTSVLQQMLAERAVRAWTLGNESRAVRLIVVREREALAAVEERLAAQEDFAQVAAQVSVDDSASEGGLVPYLVRQERSPLARAAFQAQVGEIVGPQEFGGHWILARVEGERAPLEGLWPAVAEAVEESLREHPVQDAEFVHWKLAMERRYSVDLAPLEQALGSKE